MWGCFWWPAYMMNSASVFATHVGVFLVAYVYDEFGKRLPHACGGVSGGEGGSRPYRESSPRMWGCFPFDLERALAGEVFPTHVGVFLQGNHVSGWIPRLPHACGGVSLGIRSVPVTQLSSPRMWGCFLLCTLMSGVITVFPTHVGVFPSSLYAVSCLDRLPHACGGVSGRSSAPWLVVG